MKKTTNKKLSLNREVVRTMHEIRVGARLDMVRGGLRNTHTGCTEEDTGCGIQMTTRIS